MDTIAIEVTQEDIDNGVRGQCNNCPIALAIKRTCKCKNVSVGMAIALIKKKYYKLPFQASNFIRWFDGQNMESNPWDTPLTFVLTSCDEDVRSDK